MPVFVEQDFSAQTMNTTRRAAVRPEIGASRAEVGKHHKRPMQIPVDARVTPPVGQDDARGTATNSANTGERQRMIPNEEKSAQVYETKIEEEGLLERSIAPTLRDLRAAAKDLLIIPLAEPDSTLPNVSSPRR